jgi:hypothetical protein
MQLLGCWGGRACLVGNAGGDRLAPARVRARGRRCEAGQTQLPPCAHGYSRCPVGTQLTRHAAPPQVAYWFCVHAGPLNCGPDRHTVEKGLLEKHKL